jgi:uncharacterized protein
MAHPFCHMELDTTDPTKAKSFYSALFNWKISDMDMGGGMIYSTFKPEDGPGGGIMQHPMPGAPSLWIPYVAVDDVKTSTQQATSLGAHLIKDVTEVPNMGWFSIVSDPTGAVIGLWETKK